MIGSFGIDAFETKQQAHSIINCLTLVYFIIITTGKMAHSREVVPFLHKEEGVQPYRGSLSRASIDLKDDLWKPGIPDETVQLGFGELEVITRGTMLPWCHKAIQLKKTQQFAKVAKQVLAHNGIVPDEEQPITCEEISAMLQNQEKRSPYYSTYERYFIRYERGNFYVKMQEVVYGTCTTCFRAMPLGYICEECLARHNSRSSAKAVYMYPAQD